jgi:EAL domain-containing protein (putative c-di-GMP-specific phosphodiesterase class I)/DNA-binding NarL/FixJ family response regulator
MAPSDKSSVRILALDDEPLMLEFLADTLSALGYTQVTTCNSGYRALSLLESPGADIILFDLKMPELDGLQFIRHLKGRDFTGSVLLVSGVDERIVQSSEQLVRSYGIDILGSISKPVLPEELGRVLSGWSRERNPAPTDAPLPYTAAEIRAAIAAGELINFYQPKVDMGTGEIIGAEVLVRWRHPVDGLLSPNMFISMAEHHEIIEDLTVGVITETLAQAQRWKTEGMALELSVNVSTNWLSDLQFPDLIADLATRAKIAPRHLVLEVTGGRLMDDIRAGLEILARLRLMGFGLCLDAFGASTLSLGQLRSIPFTELKVGRSLITGAWKNRNAGAAFASSMTLGQQLGVFVTAEGVETIEDWHFVKSAGCRLCQGFFVAPPMRAEQFSEWALAWRQRYISELSGAGEQHA